MKIIRDVVTPEEVKQKKSLYDPKDEEEINDLSIEIAMRAAKIMNSLHEAFDHLNVIDSVVEGRRPKGIQDETKKPTTPKIGM